MRASVVLCTHSSDRYDHFTEAADSVLAQTYDNIELVVVVDGNATLHNQVEADYGQYDQIIVHQNESTCGLLESRNTGADLATGDIVAFIDDDAVADERWIEELVMIYESTDAMAVGGKMIPEWVAGKPSFLPEEFYFLVGVTHKGFADGPGEVRNTFGSNLSIRRHVFLDLGGFETNIGGRTGDENLQGGETELCARLRSEFGQGVIYNPDAKVAHKVFEYRTEPLWLLDRAFWQGYSKRAMNTLTPETTTEENTFLRKLLTEYVIARLTQLIKSPSKDQVGQLGMIFILTAAVGAGYVYGLVRW